MAEKIQNKTLMSTKQIAQIYGVSQSRVEQLSKNGIIHGEGRPLKYDLIPTVNALFKYQRELLQKKTKNKDDVKNNSRKLKAEADFRKAKAEREEMRLKELKGELHRAEDVEAITTNHVLKMRSMLMAMPGRLAVDLSTIDSAPEIADRIKKEVFEILNGLADYRYDMEEYAKRVREREGINERFDSDEEE